MPVINDNDNEKLKHLNSMIYDFFNELSNNMQSTFNSCSFPVYKPLKVGNYLYGKHSTNLTNEEGDVIELKTEYRYLLKEEDNLLYLAKCNSSYDLLNKRYWLSFNETSAETIFNHIINDRYILFNYEENIKSGHDCNYQGNIFLIKLITDKTIEEVGYTFFKDKAEEICNTYNLLNNGNSMIGSSYYTYSEVNII